MLQASASHPAAAVAAFAARDDGDGRMVADCCGRSTSLRQWGLKQDAVDLFLDRTSRAAPTFPARAQRGPE